MGSYKKRKIAMVIGFVILFILGMAQYSFAAALTAGATYTITVEAIQSNGTPTSGANSLGLSTTAVADSNGKLSFSMSGVPTNSLYNFLLVTIKDSNNVTVRRSIVPAPASGSTLNLGVSPMTETQTEALLSGMQTAGSDDPVLVLFGGIIIRSGGFTTEGANNDVDHLANIGREAILGTDGFNDYLEGVIGITKMATFKDAIVSGLADYTSLLKDGVDALDTGTGDTGKNERAEAAARLSRILIDSAATADFDISYINAAMKAASDKVEEYLGGSGAGMNEAAVSAVDSVMMSNYMKLNAERARKKYETALTVLGATTSQISRFNAAVTTLSNAILTAFQTFEYVFDNEESALNKDAIDSAKTAVDTAMDTAFSNFMTNSASTKAEIDTMANTMYTNFGLEQAGLTRSQFQDMIDPDNSGDNDTPEDTDTYGDGMFGFYKMGGGSQNWPITMVVPANWVATYYPTTFSYTRQTDVGFPIPGPMWINNRTDFASQIPVSAMAALMGLREDIEIIMARKWAALSAASRDMTYAGYLTMDAVDRAEADGYIAANRLFRFGEGVNDDGVGDGTGDDLDGITVDSFGPLMDLAPYLTGEEVNGIEALYISRIIARQDPIGPAGITAAQKGALIATSTMPDFN